MTEKAKGKTSKTLNVRREISSLNQWKREYLPELSANERIERIFVDGSHVGSLLASRVLSSTRGQTKTRR